MSTTTDAPRSDIEAPRFVYLIDRDGELDVSESWTDAARARDIIGGVGEVEIVEQAVFMHHSKRRPYAGWWFEQLRDAYPER